MTHPIILLIITIIMHVTILFGINCGLSPRGKEAEA
jgi:hypothetical protein